MTQKTYIPGKDSSLEDTLYTARSLLRLHGFPTEFVSRKNPVKNCWSVHLRSTECEQLYTNGKGATRLASEVSAIIEFFERVSTNLFFADYYLGKDRDDDDFVFYPNEKWFLIADPLSIPTHSSDGTELLTERLREFYDPDGDVTPALLLDNNSDGGERGIAAIPFVRLSHGDTVYFPISVLNNLYASNGMAAGNTSTECRAQALSEILERHVKNQVIAKGICLPTVPQLVLDRYPRVQSDIDELREHGFAVIVKDASLGGRFPVVCVLLINPANGGCYASFGANCRFEVALERTVTELLQGRGLDQLDTFEPPSHDLAEVADALNLESHFVDSVGLLSWRMFGDRPDNPFADWDFQSGTADECGHLNDIIGSLGYESYCAEYQHCGIHTCRIVVPGMSEVYPVDDLVWSNKITGTSLRAPLLRLNRMSIAELESFTEALDGLGLSDEQAVADAIGVIFEEGTAWHSLRIGELKGMLALAVGNLREADYWCEWCRNYDVLPAPRQRLYRAIHNLVKLQLASAGQSECQVSLRLFFEESVLDDARRIVAGELTFPGLRFADTWEEVSPAHQALLGIYQRLHALQAAAGLA
jgi:ribosomal protein S12 methylthiotransferase accessory factor